MKLRGSVLHWLRHLARNLVWGTARDAELREEVDSYVDLLTDERIAAGMTPETARRRALVEVGSLDAVKEATREIRAGALVAQVWQDLRYAVRMLRRDLTFSVVAILTLALGIGANTAIFSFVHAVLLEPLGYRDPDRLVLVWERNRSIGKDRDPVAPLNFQDWRAGNTAFEDLGTYRFRAFTLTNVVDPEQLRALSMSSSVFRVLGAEPALGRVFTDEEERRRDRVVVLSNEFWQRRFAGDRAVIGRGITLDGAIATIVGVMPPAFRFPDGNAVDLYSPIQFTQDELKGRRAHTLMVIGRIRTDASIESARADIGTIAARIAAEDATSNPEVTIAGAHEVLVEDVRLTLVILLGTVAFVLLIACANVASLLMVQAASRRRELAMRAALGAGSGRLLRQLLTESVLLALLGSLAGTLLAWWLLRVFVRLRPPGLPRLDEVAIDANVLLYVVAAALVTGVLFGLAPALQVVTPRLIDATRHDDRQATASRQRARGRSVLLVAEIALSLMLLAGAGLMVRSLILVQRLDLGFDAADVLTAQIPLAPSRYPIDPSQFRAVRPDAPSPPESKASAFYAQLEARLNSLRGVESVAAVSALPLNPVGVDYDLPIVIHGRTPAREGEEPQADFRLATTGYFRSMRIPLRKGREFNELDGPNSPSVVIINETLAQRMFGGDEPLGQRLVLYGRPREIVGVVGAVRHHGFSREPRPEMILPYRQFQFGAMTLVVRSQIEPSQLATAIANAVHAIDADQPVYRVRTLEQFLSDSIAQPRLTTWLLGGFAALALVLALVGVYGVMSYTVNQRAREIGVRLALGARRHEVVWMVVRQGMQYALLGVVLGVLGAAAGTRLMSGLLFGVTATDPTTFLAATAAIAFAALAATSVPALRAARVAVVSILRAE